MKPPTIATMMPATINMPPECGALTPQCGHEIRVIAPKRRSILQSPCRSALPQVGQKCVCMVLPPNDGTQARRAKRGRFVTAAQSRLCLQHARPHGYVLTTLSHKAACRIRMAPSPRIANALPVRLARDVAGENHSKQSHALATRRALIMANNPAHHK